MCAQRRVCKILHGASRMRWKKGEEKKCARRYGLPDFFPEIYTGKATVARTRTRRNKRGKEKRPSSTAAVIKGPVVFASERRIFYDSSDERIAGAIWPGHDSVPYRRVNSVRELITLHARPSDTCTYDFIARRYVRQRHEQPHIDEFAGGRGK